MGADALKLNIGGESSDAEGDESWCGPSHGDDNTEDPSLAASKPLFRELEVLLLLLVDADIEGEELEAAAVLRDLREVEEEGDEDELLRFNGPLLLL